MIFNENKTSLLIKDRGNECIPMGSLTLVKKNGMVLYDAIPKSNVVHITQETLNEFWKLSSIKCLYLCSDTPFYITKKCISLSLFHELSALSNRKKLTNQESLRKKTLLFVIMTGFMSVPGFISFFSHIICPDTTSRVKMIITNNIGHNWTISNLAKEMALSTSSLKNRLKNEGKKYSSILMECRMEKASSLLIKKNITIKNIAFECGFKSASYFTTCFKKFYGYTPLNYIKIISSSSQY